MRIKYSHVPLIAILSMAFLLGGCSKHKNSPSEVRFANFLLPAGRAKVVMDGATHREFSLAYGSATGYNDFAEGKYEVKFFSEDGRLVISKELGIGTGSKYTIAASGIIPENTSTPVKTTKTRLLEIFEGATAHPGNANMAMGNVFFDRFEGSSDEAKLKAVHLAPALADIDLYIKKKEKLKKLTTVTYPAPSSRDYSLKPGTYDMELRLKSSEVVLYSGRVTVKSGELTTLLIYGKKAVYPYTLQVMQLQSQ